MKFKKKNLFKHIVQYFDAFDKLLSGRIYPFSTSPTTALRMICLIRRYFRYRSRLPRNFFPSVVFSPGFRVFRLLRSFRFHATPRRVRCWRMWRGRQTLRLLLWRAGPRSQPIVRRREGGRRVACQKGRQIVATYRSVRRVPRAPPPEFRSSFRID